MGKLKKKFSCSRSSGYEADDEGHGPRLISPSLFRIATFINPFDPPCDPALSSTPNFVHHALDTAPEFLHISPPPPPPPSLNVIRPNNKAHNLSQFFQKSNQNHTEIMPQESHEDGDNTAVKNTGVRVYSNGIRVWNNKRKLYMKLAPYNRLTKRNKEFIGVHYYRRTQRWETYMWLNQLERQLWFGQHFIPEAAARTSDKAQLVLRKEWERRLNYTQDDYDMDFIRECKDLSLEDLEKKLREQAKDYSEACTVGLSDTAANLLRRQISEFREFLERSEKIM